MTHFTCYTLSIEWVLCGKDEGGLDENRNYSKIYFRSELSPHNCHMQFTPSSYSLQYVFRRKKTAHMERWVQGKIQFFLFQTLNTIVRTFSDNQTAMPHCTESKEWSYMIRMTEWVEWSEWMYILRFYSWRYIQHSTNSCEEKKLAWKFFSFLKIKKKRRKKMKIYIWTF